MPKKYNTNFERDFNWYLKMRHTFSFDGCSSYFNKKGEDLIKFDSNGVSGKEAFFQYDSNGIIKPTKHPNILYALLKTKGSVNLHIKMYAEDRAGGTLPKIEFEQLCNKLDAPTWFSEAVENQKYKYYTNVA